MSTYAHYKIPYSWPLKRQLRLRRSSSRSTSPNPSLPSLFQLPNEALITGKSGDGFPTIKIGGMIRFDLAAVRAALEKRFMVQAQIPSASKSYKAAGRRKMKASPFKKEATIHRKVKRLFPPSAQHSRPASLLSGNSQAPSSVLAEVDRLPVLTGELGCEALDCFEACRRRSGQVSRPG